MDQLVLAELTVIAIMGGLTWLARNAGQPGLRRLCWTILLVVAISTTTVLVASVALFIVLSRGNPDSPAGAVPLYLAFLCAGVAVPFWIGFIIAARPHPQ